MTLFWKVLFSSLTHLFVGHMVQGYLNVGVATKRQKQTGYDDVDNGHFGCHKIASENGETIFDGAEMEAAEEVALILGKSNLVPFSK